tara:strand:+ start:4846 stop:5322 length:477 start_codon:yes stop_codon:yes gene_type:complete
MSVKIKAKNPSNILQTLTCDANGHLNTTGSGGGGGSTDMTTTNLHLSNIEGKTYIRSNTNLSSLNQTILTTNSSSVLDLSSNISSKARLWGNSNTHHDLILQFSDDNSTWISVDNINVLNINSEKSFNVLIDNPSKYIRLFNHSTQTIIINVYLELAF